MSFTGGTRYPLSSRSSSQRQALRRWQAARRSSEGLMPRPFFAIRGPQVEIPILQGLNCLNPKAAIACGIVNPNKTGSFTSATVIFAAVVASAAVVAVAAANHPTANTNIIWQHLQTQPQ